jgi:hypothetical protein
MLIERIIYLLIDFTQLNPLLHRQIPYYTVNSSITHANLKIHMRNKNYKTNNRQNKRKHDITIVVNNCICGRQLSNIHRQLFNHNTVIYLIYMYIFYKSLCLNIELKLFSVTCWIRIKKKCMY